MATTATTKETKQAKSTLELSVYREDGSVARTIALPEAVFGAPMRADLVHQVATGIQANGRQNRAHTKDRSEVSGGGKKPWKQKGTGQARHGSTRSPIWRHGGTTFGPRNERDYHEKINKKMRARAVASVLSQKLRDGEILLLDAPTFAEPKTAQAKSVLTALAKASGKADLATKVRNAALIALPEYNLTTIKSFRNIGSVLTEEVRNLNVVDLLSHRYLVLTNPEQALELLQARIANA